MTILNSKIKIHIKNNRWKEGSFPNTAEGEKVFSITDEHLKNSLINFPELESNIDFFIDWDEDNFNSSMANSEILLTWNLPTKDIDKIAPNLKWIHCIAAGVEHLFPFDWLPEKVNLTNNKGVHRKKAGEYGLMTILMLHNHFPKIISNQFNKKYDSIYSTPISGKTVVFLGTGNLGGSVAALLKPLDINVIGVNRHGSSQRDFSTIISSEKMDEILPKADILYVALPETPETINIINKQRLNLLKNTCSIVNVGRESTIDYITLFDMLKSNRLGGAILDVFSPEPVASNSDIWEIPNLIVSPHISADDGISYIKHTLDLFFKNLIYFIENKPLINQIDKKLGY